MKTIRRIAIVAGVLLLAAISLPFLIDANQFRPLLESSLTESLGREVKLGGLKLAIFSGAVEADDLSIADDSRFSPAPFLRAKSLKVGVELMPLILSRKLNVLELAIDEPRIALIQTAAGNWNFATLGGKSSSSKGAGIDLSVKRVRVSNGRLSLTQPGEPKPRVLEKLNLDCRDFSAASASAFPFTLSTLLQGNGEFQMQGKAGPIDAADSAATPVEANFSLAHLDLANSGLVDPSSGGAGLLSLDGSVSAKGHAIHIKGKLKGEKLKLSRNGSPASRPVELDWTVDHDRLKRAGTLHRGEIHLGSAVATLAGGYNLQGRAPSLNMKLFGQNMPLPELVALLPALEIVLPAGSAIEGGTASINLSMDGPVDKLINTGSIKIDRAKLTGFDLGGKLAAIQLLAGIKSAPSTDVETVSANVSASPDGTRLDDIKLVVPTVGTLTGAGTITPVHSLDFKMLALLHTSGSLMAALGQKGDTGVPFIIVGTSQNPSFKADLKNIVSEKLKGVTAESATKAATGLLEGIFGSKKKE